MATPVIGLGPVEPVSTVLGLLESTAHNGFPVFDSASPRDPATGMGRLDGFVLRAQLEVLLQRPQAWADAEGRYLSQPPDVDALELGIDAQMQAAVAGAAPAGSSRPRALAPGQPFLPGSAAGLQARGMERMPTIGDTISDARLGPPHLNLRPFMSLAPTAVRPGTPAADAHRLFLALSLRHLCVVDLRGYLRGIITRSDLDHAAGAGWWRRNRQAPTPRHTLPLRHGSGSWIATSLRSLAIPSRRMVTSLVQRMSGSPVGSILMDGAVRGGPAPDEDGI